MPNRSEFQQGFIRSSWGSSGLEVMELFVGMLFETKACSSFLESSELTQSQQMITKLQA